VPIAVHHNDPDALIRGDESVEFTFWFRLDGTRDVESVCNEILGLLEHEKIRGVQYNNTFRSPYAKLYSPE
jgi:hypothetical protein